MGYKIAYLTSKDPLNRKVSSGVYFYQSKALEKYCGEVVYLGPVYSLRVLVLKKLFRIAKKLFRVKYKYSHSLLISKIYGKIFSKKLENQHFDFILADKSSCEIAFLDTDIPVIYSTDATFQLLFNYYPQYKNLIKRSVTEGSIIEQRAICQSALIVCATQWAARSVVQHYQYDSSRVFVLPRGANIDEVPSKAAVSQRKKSEICHLLFMGSDWKRKGYDIAWKTMVEIRSQGIPVKLLVAGGKPPAGFEDEDVEMIPFINKNTMEGQKLFNSLMFRADFFFLPTRAESMGIAFCEASAFGLPVITTDTGGVTEIVRNGINGYALPYHASHVDYAQKIIDLYNDNKQYSELVESSRNYFEKRLNWDVWALSVKQILDKNLS